MNALKLEDGVPVDLTVDSSTFESASRVVIFDAVSVTGSNPRFSVFSIQGSAAKDSSGLALFCDSTHKPDGLLDYAWNTMSGDNELYLVRDERLVHEATRRWRQLNIHLLDCDLNDCDIHIAAKSCIVVDGKCAPSQPFDNHLSSFQLLASSGTAVTTIPRGSSLSFLITSSPQVFQLEPNGLTGPARVFVALRSGSNDVNASIQCPGVAEPVLQSCAAESVLCVIDVPSQACQTSLSAKPTPGDLAPLPLSYVEIYSEPSQEYPMFLRNFHSTIMRSVSGLVETRFIVPPSSFQASLDITRLGTQCESSGGSNKATLCLAGSECDEFDLGTGPGEIVHRLLKGYEQGARAEYSISISSACPVSVRGSFYSEQNSLRLGYKPVVVTMDREVGQRLYWHAGFYDSDEWLASCVGVGAKLCHMAQPGETKDAGDSCIECRPNDEEDSLFHNNAIESSIQEVGDDAPNSDSLPDKVVLQQFGRSMIYLESLDASATRHEVHSHILTHIPLVGSETDLRDSALGSRQNSKWETVTSIGLPNGASNGVLRQSPYFKLPAWPCKLVGDGSFDPSGVLYSSRPPKLLSAPLFEDPSWVGVPLKDFENEVNEILTRAPYVTVYAKIPPTFNTLACVRPTKMPATATSPYFTFSAVTRSPLVDASLLPASSVLFVETCSSWDATGTSQQWTVSVSEQPNLSELSLVQDPIAFLNSKQSVSIAYLGTSGVDSLISATNVDLNAGVLSLSIPASLSSTELPLYVSCVSGTGVTACSIDGRQNAKYGETSLCFGKQTCSLGIPRECLGVNGVSYAVHSPTGRVPILSLTSQGSGTITGRLDSIHLSSLDSLGAIGQISGWTWILVLFLLGLLWRWSSSRPHLFAPSGGKVAQWWSTLGDFKRFAFLRSANAMTRKNKSPWDETELRVYGNSSYARSIGAYVPPNLRDA